MVLTNYDGTVAQWNEIRKYYLGIERLLVQGQLGA